MFCLAGNVVEPINSLGLPPSLFVEARRPLTYVPEDIVEHCSTSNDNFNAFLHENYPHFVQDLSLLERATETFSLADLVSSNWIVSEFRLACPSCLMLMHRMPVRVESGPAAVVHLLHHHSRTFAPAAG